MAKKNIEHSEEKCTMRSILDVLGGKWSMPIIYTLFSGTKRFMELQRSVPHINTRMLAKELRNMEDNGILLREVYATVPPTVEYTLTEKGKKLKPILQALYNWGLEHTAENRT